MTNTNTTECYKKQLDILENIRNECDRLNGNYCPSNCCEDCPLYLKSGNSPIDVKCNISMIRITSIMLIKKLVDTQRQSQDNDIVSKIRTYIKGLPHSRLEKITIEIGGVTTIIHTSEPEG